MHLRTGIFICIFSLVTGVCPVMTAQESAEVFFPVLDSYMNGKPKDATAKAILIKQDMRLNDVNTNDGIYMVADYLAGSDSVNFIALEKKTISRPALLVAAYVGRFGRMANDKDRNRDEMLKAVNNIEIVMLDLEDDDPIVKKYKPCVKKWEDWCLGQKPKDLEPVLLKDFERAAASEKAIAETPATKEDDAAPSTSGKEEKIESDFDNLVADILREGGKKPPAATKPAAAKGGAVVAEKTDDDDYCSKAEASSMFRRLTPERLEKIRGDYFHSRPKINGMVIDEQAEKRYLDSLGDEKVKADEIRRLKYVSSLQGYLKSMINGIRYAGTIPTSRRRMNGQIYMANVNYLVAKVNEKQIRIKWTEIDTSGYVTIMEYFGNQRMKIDAGNVSAAERRRDAARDFILAALLADWNGDWVAASKNYKRGVSMNPDVAPRIVPLVFGSAWKDSAKAVSAASPAGDGDDQADDAQEEEKKDLKKTSGKKKAKRK